MELALDPVTDGSQGVITTEDVSNANPNMGLLGNSILTHFSPFLAKSKFLQTSYTQVYVDFQLFQFFSKNAAKSAKSDFQEQSPTPNQSLRGLSRAAP